MFASAWKTNILHHHCCTWDIAVPPFIYNQLKYLFVQMYITSSKFEKVTQEMKGKALQTLPTQILV